MADTAPEDITRLLLDWGNGDRAALDRLVSVLYKELRRIASRQMRRERSSASIHTTALVNEAYLRLVDYRRVRPKDRAHFIAIAAQAMRRILVDRARFARTAKRGGAARPLPLDEAADVALEHSREVLALDAALTQFVAFDARKAQMKGDASTAYDLAAKAYAASKSQDAAIVMALAACKMGDAGRAKKAVAKLKGSRRDEAIKVCSGKGITIDS